MNVYSQQTCHDVNALLSCHFYDLLPFFMLIIENTSIQKNQNSMNHFDMNDKNSNGYCSDQEVHRRKSFSKSSFGESFDKDRRSFGQTKSLFPFG